MFECTTCKRELDLEDRWGQTSTCRECVQNTGDRDGEYTCPGACGMKHDTEVAAKRCCEDFQVDMPQFKRYVTKDIDERHKRFALKKAHATNAANASKAHSPWHNRGNRDERYYSKKVQESEKDDI